MDETVSEPVSCETKPTRLPEWASKPFKELLDLTERQINLLDLCVQGIHVATTLPNVLEVLQNPDSSIEEIDRQDYEEKLRFAQTNAARARREIDEDFPLCMRKL